MPFLDLELMRFVERIPARVRVRPRAGKRLHRMAMERLLPPGIASRPKHGFSTPYDDWLRRSLGEEVERRYAPGPALAELHRARRGRRGWWRSTAAAARTTRASSTACSSCPSGTPRSWRRGSPVAA